MMIGRMVRFGFTQEITKKQWRDTFPTKHWKSYLDDLQFTTTFNGGVNEMIEYIHNNPEPDLHYKGIGMLLYNMGKDNIQDKLVINKIEKNLYKFKNQFSHRLAFGSFQGFLALSIDNLYIQEFLQSEFLNYADKISNTKQQYCHLLALLEAIDIVIGCGKNKVLSREYLHSIIENYAKPHLLTHYSGIKNSPQKQLRLFEALIAAQYFDEELFDRVMLDLVVQQKIRKLTTLLRIHQLLKDLNEQGDFPRSLDEQIQTVMDRMKAKEDFVWCFNFEEMRYYTMDEMRNKREDYKHPQQAFGRFLHFPKGLNEKYIQIRDQGEEGISKEEEEARQQKLIDEQLYDTFLLNKLKEKEQQSKEQSDNLTSAFEERYKNLPAGMELEVESDDEDQSESESDDDVLQVTKKPKKKLFKKRKGRPQRGDEMGFNKVDDD